MFYKNKTPLEHDVHTHVRRTAEKELKQKCKWINLWTQFESLLRRLYNSICSGPSIYICAAQLIFIIAAQLFAVCCFASTHAQKFQFFARPNMSPACIACPSLSIAGCFAWPYRKILDHTQTPRAREPAIRPSWNEEKSPSPSSRLNELKASHFASFAFLSSLLSRSRNFSFVERVSYVTAKSPPRGDFLWELRIILQLFFRDLVFLRWEIAVASTKSDSTFLIAIAGPREPFEIEYKLPSVLDFNFLSLSPFHSLHVQNFRSYKSLQRSLQFYLIQHRE